MESRAFRDPLAAVSTARFEPLVVASNAFFDPLETDPATPRLISAADFSASRDAAVVESRAFRDPLAAVSTARFEPLVVASNAFFDPLETDPATPRLISAADFSASRDRAVVESRAFRDPLAADAIARFEPLAAASNAVFDPLETDPATPRLISAADFSASRDAAVVESRAFRDPLAADAIARFEPLAAASNAVFDPLETDPATPRLISAADFSARSLLTGIRFAWIPIVYQQQGSRTTRITRHSTIYGLITNVPSARASSGRKCARGAHQRQGTSLRSAAAARRYGFDAGSADARPDCPSTTISAPTPPARIAPLPATVERVCSTKAAGGVRAC